MREFAQELTTRFGIEPNVASDIAQYVSENWERISSAVEAQPSPADVGDDAVGPTESPEETASRIDDDEGWVLRQADSC